MLSASYSFFIFYYVQSSEESQYISEIYRLHTAFFQIESSPLITCMLSSQLFFRDFPRHRRYPKITKSADSNPVKHMTWNHRLSPMSHLAKLEYECALWKTPTATHTINISSLMEHPATGRTMKGESPFVMINNGVLWDASAGSTVRLLTPCLVAKTVWVLQCQTAAFPKEKAPTANDQNS